VAVRILTRVPITFGGHAPAAPGTIGGIETLFVLDTGSDVHILTKELVDRLGLAVEPGEEGVDHSGATMPSWSVEETALTLDGLDVVLREIVSIPAPRPFPALGIGGILSPQRLHPTAVTVIDLLHDELLLVDPEAEELVRWLEARSPELSTLSLDRDPSFPSLVVRGISVRPFAELPTLLNTGGKRTEFSRQAVPGLVGGVEERLGGGVSGADVMGSTAGARVLEAAGREVHVSELAVREIMQGPQGMIGIDVLRGTVLAFSGDLARPVVWQI
jgi:hypothetical protein